MSEVENKEMMTESMQDALDSVEEVKIGDVVKGEVLSIQDNKQAIVGIIGVGVEGVVPFNELSSKPFDNVTDVMNIGDEVELVVIKQIKDKENGSFLLSKRRLETKKVWNELQEKFDNGEIIETEVKKAVKGGLTVDLGVRGFIPASMVENHFVNDFKPYEGKTLRLKIVEIEPSEGRLILSHKEIAAEEAATRVAEAMEHIEEGSTIEGEVVRLTNFGAFIDLGGVDGLVHISEISHSHVARPGDVLAVGEKVNVKVLGVDKEAGRISLSIKETLPGPWDNIEERAAVDAVLAGVVKRLTTFGAFVEIFLGVEGLVHISQISHNHIATPHEVLEEGQEVNVKVLDVNPEERRVSLSIKALEEAPERPKRENKAKQPKKQTIELPEEDTGFTLGELLGSQLQELTDGE